MNEKRWDIVLIATAIVLLIAGGVWWLESRFNPQVAIMSIGLLFGTFVFVFGALFGVRATRAGAQTAADIHQATMEVETQRQKVLAELTRENREYAKLHVAAGKAQITQQMLDYRRVDQLAQQRAQLIAKDSSAQNDDEWWTADYESAEYQEIE